VRFKSLSEGKEGQAQLLAGRWKNGERGLGEGEASHVHLCPNVTKVGGGGGGGGGGGLFHSGKKLAFYRGEKTDGSSREGGNTENWGKAGACIFWAAKNNEKGEKGVQIH